MPSRSRGAGVSSPLVIAMMRISLDGDRVVRVDAVVFDLFHTLADPQAHAAPGFRALDAVAAILAVPSSDLELWWQQHSVDFLTSPISPIDELVAFARDRRIVLSPTAVAEIDRALGGAQDAALLEPIPGVVDTLAVLHDREVRLGLLSNAHVRDVRRLGESPLAPELDDMCVSCFIGVAKPSAEAYRMSLDRIGVPPGLAVFVGAGGEGELAGARAEGFAGIVAITGPANRGGWRSRGEQDRIEAQADVVVADVGDLVGLIEG